MEPNETNTMTNTMTYEQSNAAVAECGKRQADACDRMAVATEREAAAWEDIASSVRELLRMAKEDNG
jgi:hypothetical protein